MVAPPKVLSSVAWSVLACVVGVIGVVVALVAEPDSVLAVPDGIERSGVLVTADGCRVPSYGTGAVTAAGIVTNAHVVAGSSSVQVSLAEGSAVPATVVAFDPVHDLALLRTAELVGKPLSLAEPVAPAQLVALGRTTLGEGAADIEVIEVDLERTVTITISDIYGQGRYDRAGLTLGAKIGPGDSGAPLVNQDGQLVGVVFSAARGSGEVAYGIATSEVRRLIDGAGVDGVATGKCRD